MGEAPGGDRPVFIVGCPRSGTTLLQLMLHSHPRIAIPPETRHLIPAYRERAGFGDLSDPVARRALAGFITAKRQFRDLKLDREAITERIVAGPPTVGSALAIVLAGYAERYGKPRWGDKRPGYFQDLDIILRLFPNAQIVHLVRDGRDCVASLKQMSWFTEDSVAAMVLWARAVDATHRARRRLPADTFHELRYEDLVADPEPELRRLCGFLREDYHPAMALPSGTAGQAVPTRKTWHGRTHGSVDATAVRHGGRLEPWERRLMEAMSSRRLRSHGYPVDAGPDGGPPLADRLRYLRTAGTKQAMLTRRRLADRLLDLQLHDDVADRTGLSGSGAAGR